MMGIELFTSFELLSSPYIKNRLKNIDDSHDEPLFEDLNLLITIRNETQKWTQHLISSFISFDKLSSSHKAFLCHLNPIEILKIVQ